MGNWTGTFGKLVLEPNANHSSLLALAQGAREYKFCRPRISERNIIQIQGGRFVQCVVCAKPKSCQADLDRHPLQERTVPSYVPNNTSIVGGSGGSLQSQTYGDRLSDHSQERPDSAGVDGPSMLIMTGPNYSGKSVYLKQIALIVYMAHVGCFVPAKRAIIGLTDKILTRIATRETVSRFQSAFMIDLQQVALAMAQATPRSLVIIDEFGKGTESCGRLATKTYRFLADFMADGAGLACGVFEYLLGLGESRPKVLGATHFHEIFENGFLRSRSSLGFGHMQVLVGQEAEDVEDQITYLYK